MFRDFELKIQGIKTTDLKSFFKMKMKREDLLWNYNVLNMAIKMKSLRGTALHKIILEKIKISKDLFLLAIN